MVGIKNSRLYFVMGVLLIPIMVKGMDKQTFTEFYKAQKKITEFALTIKPHEYKADVGVILGYGNNNTHYLVSSLANTKIAYYWMDKEPEGILKKAWELFEAENGELLEFHKKLTGTVIRLYYGKSESGNQQFINIWHPPRDKISWGDNGINHLPSNIADLEDILSGKPLLDKISSLLKKEDLREEKPEDLTSDL